MKPRPILIMSLFLFFCGVLGAQGPLTNALNLMTRSDGAGSLITSNGAYTSPDGPLTALANLRLRTDSNGYLITTTGSGGSTIPIASCYGWVGVSNGLCLSGTSTALKSADGGAYLIVSNGSVFVNSADLTLGSGGTSFVVIRGNVAAKQVQTLDSGFTTGEELTIGSATLGTCTAGTITTGSHNFAGGYTGNTSSSCVINFGTPAWTNAPFCGAWSIASTTHPRISAVSTTSMTVTGGISGEAITYICRGRIGT